MTVEGQKDNLVDEDRARDRFPIGMRVLAVDDNPTCLKVLENLLRKCQYQVTTTYQATEALKILRENRKKFDLVISDVNMPDMDGFKLLEHVGLEMDLPVIMLSEHSDTNLVMKGVTHGACDYLLKPVRIEELKNIWQHVVRRKKFDCKDQSQPSNKDASCNMDGEGSHVITSENIADQSKSMGKRRKDQSEDDEEDDGEENEQVTEDPSTQKKPRVVWCGELHAKFIAAVQQLGYEKAVPKKILDLMNVEGLTRENVASHLQKFRLYLKKAAEQAALCSNDSSYLRMGSSDGYGDLRTLSGLGRLSSSVSSSYPSSGMFGRLNSPAGLSMRGISSSGLIRPGQSQNMSSSINTLGNQQPSMLPANQSSGLLQRIPTSIVVNQSQQSNRSTSMRQLCPVNNLSGFNVGTSFPDSRVSINSPNISVSGVSSNHLMAHGNSQQSHNTVAFRKQSSLRPASLNGESFDVGGTSSSKLLEYSRCNESWEGTSHLSKFTANTLPLSETFNNVQLLPSHLNISSSNPHFSDGAVKFPSSSTITVPFENAGDELKCPKGLIANAIPHSGYTHQQGWQEHKQDDNQNMNYDANSISPLISSNAVTSFVGQSLSHNNAVYSRRNDPPLIGHLNGATSSITALPDVEKFSSDTRMKPNGPYVLEPMKSQDNLIQNDFASSFDDLISGMVQQDQNDMILVGDDLVFEGYPITSCI